MPNALAAELKKLLLPCTTFNSKPTKKTSPTASRFGGVPYLEAGEEWPACASCEAPLAFIAQINAKDCPSPFAGNAKLLTFFYCWDCNPFEGSPGEWTVHLYPEPDDKKAAAAEDQSPQPTELCELVPAAGKSLPTWEGIDTFDENIMEVAGELSDDPWEPYNAAAKSLGAGDDMATQAGGYPHWLQGNDTPACDRCHKPMGLLAQFDSNEDAGIMWGDAGLVYLFICPAHPKERQLIFQCC